MALFNSQYKICKQCFTSLATLGFDVFIYLFVCFIVCVSRITPVRGTSHYSIPRYPKVLSISNWMDALGFLFYTRLNQNYKGSGAVL